MSVRSLLETARSILTEKTWVKGAYAEAGGYCSMGAVFLAAGYDAAVRELPFWFPDDVVDAQMELDEAADVVTAGAFDEITVLNDDPATTLTDVLRVFDKAIVSVS